MTPAAAGVVLTMLTIGDPSQRPTPAASSQTTAEPAAGAARGDCPPASGFIYRTIPVDDRRLPCVVYVPPEYTPQRAWPVILFLHGSGERGSDGFAPMDVGIGPALRRPPGHVQAVVVMPQAPAGEVWWSDAMVRFALRSLEDISRDYHLDPQRVYLTGISLGGAGVLHLAQRIRGRVAAVAPVCAFLGRPDVPADPRELEALAEALRDVPVWLFHGANDPAVPVARAREIMASLRKTNPQARYTEYPTGDHLIWDRVYGDPQFWAWLLSQRLPAAGK